MPSLKPLLLTFLLWEGVLALYGWYLSPGLGDVPQFVFPIMVFGSMTLGLVMVWTLVCQGFVEQRVGWGRWRRLAVIQLPALLAMCALGFGFVLNPPSPHAFFHYMIGERLPENAHDFRVKGNFAADPGNVYYYFRTNAAGARSLAERLHLSEAKLSAEDAAEQPDYLIYPVDLYLRGVPDPLTWAGRHQYFRRDASGTGLFMITNSGMTEVFFARDPLYSKSDEELGVGGTGN